jgi:branched-chain amino acid transport system permease protein
MKKYAFPLMVAISFTLPHFILDDPYKLHVATLMCINLMLATSLQLILTMGLLSLAHTAFMAIGAYSSALIVMQLSQSFWLGLMVGCCISFIVAGMLGALVLRTIGAYFFLVTMAFLLAAVLFFNNFFVDVFGGPAGIVAIPPPTPIPLFGITTISFSSKLAIYNLGLVFMWLSMGILLRIDKTRVGMICKSLEQAENLSESIGIDTFAYKLRIFIIASLIATVAGSFYAHTVSVITPYDFDLHAVVLCVIFVVVGGKDHVWGPFIGTIILTLLAEYLRDFGAYERLTYSVVLILIMIFMPGGLITLFDKIKFAKKAIFAKKENEKNATA